MHNLDLRINRETGNPKKPGKAVYRIHAEVDEGDNELGPLIAHLMVLNPATVPDFNQPDPRDESMRAGDVHMPPANERSALNEFTV